MKYFSDAFSARTGRWGSLWLALFGVLFLGLSTSHAQTTTAQLRGGIVINEILVDPNGANNFDTDGSGSADTEDEFVELYNVSGGTIDLSGMQLWRDNLSWFTFPAGSNLGAGEYAMVINNLQGGTLPTACNGLTFSAGYTGGGALANGSDNVVLYDPTANQYVQLTYNGAAIDNPVATYTAFPAGATRVGPAEAWGSDSDGLSLTREPDGDQNVAVHNTLSGGNNASPAAPQTGCVTNPLANLLITEVIVTPTAGEYIEIHNKGGSAIDLSDVYLTDATFAGGGVYYYNITTGANYGGGGFGDFHAHFPAGATIAAGEYQTIAIAGSTDFNTTYGVNPTYELYEDAGTPDAIPDMREAVAGSINDQGGLTNGGEVAILYTWDGASDLVQDIDYFVWGDKVEGVDKTGVTVGAGTYNNDTAIGSQDAFAPGGTSHPSGQGFSRTDNAEGAETQAGGNGVVGSNETSEDLATTWTICTPTPNAANTTCSVTANLVINEIHADPDGSIAGDANGDGTRDGSDDEFVEIVNNSATDLDVSGWEIRDGAGSRHIFPAGTIISANCAIVVFGGGTPTGVFGGALVQTASTGSLGLSNSGDDVEIYNGATLVTSYTYGGEGGNNQSITLDPDVTGATPLVQHTGATGAAGALFSPGTRVDGSNFSGCSVPNIPPAVATNTDQVETVGTAFTFTPITFTDADGDPMTYTATFDDYYNSALPSWISFDGNTGQFTGTAPNNREAGVYYIEVTANDGNGGTTSETFKLTMQLQAGASVLTASGQYQTGAYDDSAAEIPAYDPATQRLFVVNGDADAIDVLDVSNPAAPTLIFQILADNLASFTGGAPNSVAVHNGLVAVAVANDPATNPGEVVLFQANTATATPAVNQYTVGSLPDMLTFTPNGNYVLVAIEGEPADDYSVDPEGEVAILDISGGAAAGVVNTATFTAFNGQEFALRAAGAHFALTAPGFTLARDVEPEYITANNTTAWVSLQENNILAKVDIASATVTNLYPMGYVDHSQYGSWIDASDRDHPTINNDPYVKPAPWPLRGLFQPDAITSMETGGQTYILTANEGDSRDYAAYSEEDDVDDLTLDPTVFPDFALFQDNENMGRLGLTNAKGDTDNDGDYDAMYVYGTRSFSIFDENGNIVFNSGDDFEQITAVHPATAAFYNANNDNSNLDNRSDNKGPEPEAIIIYTVCNRTYAFIGLERVGGIMVYDVTDVNDVQFVEYVTTRNFAVNDATSDSGPEGFAIMETPSGDVFLAVANEVSGTTRFFQINTPSTIQVTSSMTDFVTSAVGVPSPEQSYTVQAFCPQGDVTLNAPAEFEISLTSGGPYSTSVVIPQATAATATTIYVRYNPSNASDPHTGNIAHTSTGASPQTLALEGHIVTGIIPIREARDNGLNPLGSTVTITGTFSASDHFLGAAYIQDFEHTGAFAGNIDGLAIYDWDVHDAGLFNIGDSIIITGTLAEFNGLRQLTNVDPADIILVSTGRSLPQQIVPVDQLANYPSELVTINNVSFPRAGDIFFGGSNYDMTVGGLTGELRVDNDVNSLIGRVIPANCTVTGVVSRFNATRQILPRFLADVPCAQPYVAPTTAASCVPAEEKLKVATWNVEWFGATNGSSPTDPNLFVQKDSAKLKIKAMNADIYALQEITNETLLSQLVNELTAETGETYGYVINTTNVSYPPNVAGDRQKLAFVFKTAKISPVSSTGLLEYMHPYYNGGDTQYLDGTTAVDGTPGGQVFPDIDHTRFYASGRLPFMLEADVTVNGVTERVYFINLHARSSSQFDRYQMRSYDIARLEEWLAINHPNDKLVILGDFNDDLDVSITTSPSQQVSPYDVFTNNPAAYNGITESFSTAGLSTTRFPDAIDHIMISNELFSSYNNNASEKIYQEFISGGYFNTTSDHLPVSVELEITTPVSTCTFNAVGSNCDRVQLTWTDNSFAETGYEIEVSTDNVTFNPLTTTAANVTSFAHTGLTNDTQYYYRITAVNALGNSPAQAGTATTFLNCSTGGGGSSTTQLLSPDYIAAFGQSSTSILLEWSDRAINEQGYYIYRAEGNGAYTLIAIVPGGSGLMSYMDTGLNPDTQYHYYVVAYLGADLSTHSDQAEDYTFPEAPMLVSVDSACYNGQGQITVSGTHASQLFRWYESDTAAMPIMNGAGTTLLSNTFTTDFLQTGRTYYVEALGFRYPSAQRVPVHVGVLPRPNAQIANGSLYVACGDTGTLEAVAMTDVTAYNWYYGNTYLGEGQQFSVQRSGIYTLRTMNTNGCLSAVQEVEVRLNGGPSARILEGAALTYCEGGQLTAEAKNGVSYAWTKDGNPLNISTATLDVTEGGTYVLTITDIASGCTATDTAVVNFLTLPDAVTLSADDTELCIGENATLTVTSSVPAGATITWERNGSFLAEDVTNLTVSAAGEYTATVSYASNNGGCAIASQSLTISKAEQVPARILNLENTLEISTTGNITDVQWFLNGNPEPSFNGQAQITPQVAGHYSALVTYATGCTATTRSTYWFAGVTGIEDEDLDAQDFAIFPNPTSGKLNVRLGSLAGEAYTLKLTDALGRTLQTLKADSQARVLTLDLGNLPAGTYLLHLEGESQTLVRKVVRQ